MSRGVSVLLLLLHTKSPRMCVYIYQSVAHNINTHNKSSALCARHIPCLSLYSYALYG